MLKKALIPLLISLILLEALLAGALFFMQKGLAARIAPAYHWSTYTSSGTRLGSQAGKLKLELRPFITYGNVPGQKLPFLTTNSKGYRGSELEEKRGRERAVLVGGSAAFGTGLPSDQDTFAEQLELLRDIEVVNAAVIGHQSGQELAYITAELLDTDPDLIIAYDGWNDFMQTAWQGSIAQVGDVSFYQIEKQLEILSAMTDSNPFVRLVHGLPRVLLPTVTRGFQTVLNGEAEQVFTEEGMRATNDMYIKNIEKMATIAEAFGARFLLVLQADKRVMLQDLGKSFAGKRANTIAELYRAFCKRARKELESSGIEILELHEHAADIDPKLFMDNVHLNAEGNKIVAGIVSDFLADSDAASEIQTGAS